LVEIGIPSRKKLRIIITILNIYLANIPLFASIFVSTRHSLMLQSGMGKIAEGIVSIGHNPDEFCYTMTRLS